MKIRHNLMKEAVKLKEKFNDFFLHSYSDKSILLQKKAKALLLTLIFCIVACSVYNIVLILTTKLLIDLITYSTLILVFILDCFIIRKSRYQLAANICLICSVIFVSIPPFTLPITSDFQLYHLAFVLLLILILTVFYSTKKYQFIIIFTISVIFLVLFFIYISINLEGGITKLSLTTTGAVFTVFILSFIIIVNINNMFLKTIKAEFDLLEELKLSSEKLLSYEKNEKEKLFKKNSELLKELENIKKNYNYNDFIFQSKKMINIINLIEQLKDVDSTVLITGESGVGKELIAKALHKTSSRSDKIFTAINCAAIPDNLLESEFFGYEKGAFTGAIKDSKGKFEISDGGTIFLDEIGELHLDLQAKLLRVLQEKKITKIGGKNEISVDCRVICATNKDLKTLIKEKKFREDLYYRVNVISIDVPPLRNRKEDVLLLFEYFIDKYSKKYNREIVEIEKTIFALLENYNWPGNVRELENLSNILVIRSKEGKITKEDLPENIINNIHSDIYADITIDDIDKNGTERNYDLKELVSEYEKKIITNIFYQSNKNLRKTSRILGISFGAIQYKIEKYKIE